jgi:putative acyl-CoA dehydrogenase
MVAVLSELCAESEAHTLTAMRLSSAFDKMEHNKDEAEANFFRIAVAVSKYFVTKRAPQFIYECMEAHGGNGFVEDYPLAMLYRHAPLNSIWEGSGNVMVLDILRAGKGLPLLLKEIALSQGMDKHMDEFTNDHRSNFRKHPITTPVKYFPDLQHTSAGILFRFASIRNADTTTSSPIGILFNPLPLSVLVIVFSTLT